MIEIQLKSVGLAFGAYAAIRDISFQVPRGQFVALVGPTGCGKSSVLNLVAGTLGPTAVAFFTDRVFRDPLALRYSLAVVNCIGMIATIGLLVVGMPAYRRTSQALAASR